MVNVTKGKSCKIHHRNKTAHRRIINACKNLKQRPGREVHLHGLSVFLWIV